MFDFLLAARNKTNNVVRALYRINYGATVINCMAAEQSGQ